MLKILYKKRKKRRGGKTPCNHQHKYLGARHLPAKDSLRSQETKPKRIFKGKKPLNTTDLSIWEQETTSQRVTTEQRNRVIIDVVGEPRWLSKPGGLLRNDEIKKAYQP